jgi:hypothetical protein
MFFDFADEISKSNCDIDCRLFPVLRHDAAGSSHQLRRAG